MNEAVEICDDVLCFDCNSLSYCHTILALVNYPKQLHIAAATVTAAAAVAGAAVAAATAAAVVAAAPVAATAPADVDCGGGDDDDANDGNVNVDDYCCYSEMAESGIGIVDQCNLYEIDSNGNLIEMLNGYREMFAVNNLNYQVAYSV